MTHVPHATVIYNHTKNTIEFDLPSYPPQKHRVKLFVMHTIEKQEVL